MKSPAGSEANGPIPRRIAIVDRGDAAMRLIHAIRETALETGRSIESVIIHPGRERSSLAVREATDAVDADALGDSFTQGSVDRLEAVLRATKADAVWTAWSPVFEQRELSEVCDRLHIRLMGYDDKSHRGLNDVVDRARAGGEVVEPPNGYAISSVTVHIAGDGAGTVSCLGHVITLDAGIEYCDSGLDSRVAETLREAAVRYFDDAGARGLAAITFAAIKPGELQAIKAVCGLTPGHLAIEAATGTDIAKLQLTTELGWSVGFKTSPPSGASFTTGLAVAERSGPTARVELLRTPAGPGVRVDSGAAEGELIGGRSTDSALARITTWGRTENEARARLQRALSETTAVVSGTATNKGILLQSLKHGEDPVASDAPKQSSAAAALLNAAIEAHDADETVERARFLVSAARGRPRIRSELGRPIDLRFAGHRYRFHAYRAGPDMYEVDVGGRTIAVHVDRLSPFERNLTCDGRRIALTSSIEGVDYVVEADGRIHRVTRDDGGLLRAPAPAVVIAILVEPGDRVTPGDPIAVLEAMKMQTYVTAPFEGTVAKVLVAASMQVDAGAPLVRFAPVVSEEPSLVAPVTFDYLEAPTRSPNATDKCLIFLAGLRQRVLGWDTRGVEGPPSDSDWAGAAGDAPSLERLNRAEDEILSIFADVCALARRQGLASDERVHAPQDDLRIYLRTLNADDESLSTSFKRNLRAVLARYDIENTERSEPLEDAMFRVFKALDRSHRHARDILAILERRLEPARQGPSDQELRDLLDNLITATQHRYPNVSDLARSVRHSLFIRPILEGTRRRVDAEMEGHLVALERGVDTSQRARHIEALVQCPQPLAATLSSRLNTAPPQMRPVILEVLMRRYYRIRNLRDFQSREIEGRSVAEATFEYEGNRVSVISCFASHDEIEASLRSVAELAEESGLGGGVVIDVHSWAEDAAEVKEAGSVRSMLDAIRFPAEVRRVTVSISSSGETVSAPVTKHYVFSHEPTGWEEDGTHRGLHPMMAERLGLWRLANFEVERLPSVDDVYLFHAVAHENPRDERLIAIAEVRDLTPVRDPNGRVAELPHLERIFTEALAGIRVFQSQRPPHRRLYWNRVLLYVWPPIELQADELLGIVYKLARLTEGLGLERVDVLLKMRDANTGLLQERLLAVTNPVGRDLAVRLESVHQRPIRPMSSYSQKVLRMRQRGLVYPYEIVKMLTFTSDEGRAGFPPGTFTEYDIDHRGELVPVDRPHGENRANIVVGVITNFTPAYPEGMARVALFGDPSKGLGSLAEAECFRIIKGLELAEKLGVPAEWFAISAGAKIAMDSGTENMDWIGRVLKSLIEFTQKGGEVNVIVCGINVGAQPYWNAEATMLMHTRGILIMTSDSAMVLTGKQALDYSGGVSAADNYGIGGYENIMGPNGQAQFWARDVGDACRLLLRYYAHTYKVPGERFPRRAQTNDPFDRDVQLSPHRRDESSSFESIGDVFSEEKNPGRKRPFDIRSIMKAVVDIDHAPLERWTGMQDAETAVVWDAHIGGWPVCLLGIESKPIARKGFVPADGPDHWTSGTLFPRSSKKIARAINSASGNRPFVVLANLSGFDGSPDSMRNLQLEYGAEIGRAVVNFDGPLIFCVVSRYHGGAFVVFSATLNEDLEVAAVEGSYASVIGGAPAAAVVFTRDVDARTDADPRLQDLRRRLEATDGAERAELVKEFEALRARIRTEKLGEVADEFDKIHTIHRALEVGSVHRIIPPDRIRPYIVDAIDRGVQRTLERADLSSTPSEE